MIEDSLINITVECDMLEIYQNVLSLNIRLYTIFTKFRNTCVYQHVIELSVNYDETLNLEASKNWFTSGRTFVWKYFGLILIFIMNISFIKAEHRRTGRKRNATTDLKIASLVHFHHRLGV